MKKFSMILLALMALAFVAPAAFAQTAAGGTMEPTNWVAITSGFAMAIASAACGAERKAINRLASSASLEPATMAAENTWGN